ncbi:MULTISPECIES: hypothetical protein [Brucella]|uniref:Uncharacterized protein n=1 Tax=Brucella suis bv. 4 TaxID=1567501 RepID=A0A7L9MJZ2_BRUSS|nr:hypothetical protein DMS17_11575 [Brucella melitensis]AYU65154.1 hypothetical protein EAI02_11975 [Brucella abortus]MRN43342.1 hypothetical protein [Brucella sp. 09RB8913]MRN46535.1 hypothetical protein [Brucella sp. 10RB9212]MRN50586.1 hypothetical protein [Brucella sp. 10RB9214]MRN58496.1 hypothetical protein [Brucella sp. 09RB8918]MRN66835.1 hypothetical protein [Brucella sp. 10RB9213]MRN78101.1 hypothetical protein [Brucella sp. 10RB9210]PXG05553.1 hypothetical protein DMP29_15495 [B
MKHVFRDLAIHPWMRAAFL